MIPDGIFSGSSSSHHDNPWTAWKNKRTRLGDDPKNETALVETCAAWFDPALVDRFPDLLLSGPFETTWRATSVDADVDGEYDDSNDDDDDIDRPVFRVSCAKWETTCLLARVIVGDLRRAVAADASSEERKRRAVRVAACSREAIDALEEMVEEGERKAMVRERRSRASRGERRVLSDDARPR